MQERQALPSSGLMMREYRSMDQVASAVVGVPLAAGNYRVVATNTTSLCSSSVTLFTVNDVSVTPVITQNTITNNTNCTGASSNGSITIDVMEAYQRLQTLPSNGILAQELNPYSQQRRQQHYQTLQQEITR